MNWYKTSQEKERDLTCPECGSKLKLQQGDYGLYYRCENYPKCKVTHGAFKDGKPIGVPGDLETIALRKAAHNKINELLKNETDPKEAQQRYYNWLAGKLNVPKNMCHMALFDKKTLRRVVGICNYLIERKKKRQEELKFQPELNLSSNNNQIIKEAGLKENILTMALASLFLLPLDIMAFKYLKNRNPNAPTSLIIDNLKQAKQIKENVETNKYTPEEKKTYDEANVLKGNINPKEVAKQNVSLNNLVDVILQHEDLIPKQTPFLITSEKMRQWDHIHGKFETDKINPSYQERVKLGRQNFIFLKNPNDVFPAVVTQLKKYVANPAYYELPPNPTIKDAIYVFDQTGANGKIKYIQQKLPNINVNAPLSSLK